MIRKLIIQQTKKKRNAHSNSHTTPPGSGQFQFIFATDI